MKAIVELTEEEYNKYYKMYADLREKVSGHRLSDLFKKLDRRNGYARYNFSGDVSDLLISLLGRMPTGEEIIMIIDGGYSHFGASCYIDKDGHFSGHVCID